MSSVSGWTLGPGFSGLAEVSEGAHQAPGTAPRVRSLQSELWLGLWLGTRDPRPYQGPDH